MKLLLASTVLAAIAYAQYPPPCPPICPKGGNKQATNQQKSVKASPSKASTTAKPIK